MFYKLIIFVFKVFCVLNLNAHFISVALSVVFAIIKRLRYIRQRGSKSFILFHFALSWHAYILKDGHPDRRTNVCRTLSHGFLLPFCVH